jgi:hypothetical protein
MKITILVYDIGKTLLEYNYNSVLKIRHIFKQKKVTDISHVSHTKSGSKKCVVILRLKNCLKKVKWIL